MLHSNCFVGSLTQFHSRRSVYRRGRSRISYAGQRCGLHLDGVKSGRKAKRSYVADQVRIIAAGLGLDEQSTAAMTAGARLLPYAEGEIIQRVNTVPEEVGFITEGEAGMFARAEEGRNLPIGELGVGDYFGGTALTRQRMQVGVVALTDTTVIGVSRRGHGGGGPARPPAGPADR